MAAEEGEKVEVRSDSITEAPGSIKEGNVDLKNKIEVLTPPDGGRGWLVILGSFLVSHQQRK